MPARKLELCKVICILLRDFRGQSYTVMEPEGPVRGHLYNVRVPDFAAGSFIYCYGTLKVIHKWKGPQGSFIY